MPRLRVRTSPPEPGHKAVGCSKPEAPWRRLRCAGVVSGGRRWAPWLSTVLFDKRGTGLSDPVVGTPTLDERVEDFRAVRDAAGSRRSTSARSCTRGRARCASRTYEGSRAHLASRVLDHAGANEIVVTGTVRDLTLGAGLHFKSRASVELRGEPGSWELLTLDMVQLSELASIATTAPERTVSSAQGSMHLADRSLVAAARRG